MVQVSWLDSRLSGRFALFCILSHELGELFQWQWHKQYPDNKLILMMMMIIIWLRLIQRGVCVRDDVYHLRQWSVLVTRSVSGGWLMRRGQREIARQCQPLWTHNPSLFVTETTSQLSAARSACWTCTASGCLDVSSAWPATVRIIHWISRQLDIGSVHACISPPIISLAWRIIISFLHSNSRNILFTR